MKYYSLFIALNICFLTIKSTDAVQCKISNENGEQSSSSDAEACYLIIEIDFRTKQRSIHYSDSKLTSNKDNQHGSLQIDTLITLDQQSDQIRSILIYTCTKPSFCNEQMTAGLIQIINKALQHEFLSGPSMSVLHRLLVKTAMNSPVHCMNNNNDVLVECKSGLCFGGKSQYVDQSCFNIAVKTNETIQIKYKIIMTQAKSVENIASEISYTCNVDQCNSRQIINQIKEILESNIVFDKYHISKRSVSSIGKTAIQTLKFDLAKHLLKVAASEGSSVTGTTTNITHSPNTTISTPGTTTNSNGHINYPILILILSALILAMQCEH